MLIGPISLTPDRVLSVAFTGPYVPDLLGLIMLKTKTHTFSSTKVFVTFSLHVWAAIFGSVCLIGGVLYLVYASGIISIVRGKQPPQSLKKGKEVCQMSSASLSSETLKSDKTVGCQVDVFNAGTMRMRSVLSDVHDNKTFKKESHNDSESSETVSGDVTERSSNDRASLLDSLWGSYSLYLDQGELKCEYIIFIPTQTNR